MNYNDLLDKLWILDRSTTEKMHGAKLVAALRAILTLHKPVAVFDCDHNCDYHCIACLSAYPCFTVQAIEKEME